MEIQARITKTPKGFRLRWLGAEFWGPKAGLRAEVVLPPKDGDAGDQLVVAHGQPVASHPRIRRPFRGPVARLEEGERALLGDLFKDKVEYPHQQLVDGPGVSYKWFLTLAGPGRAAMADGLKPGLPTT